MVYPSIVCYHLVVGCIVDKNLLAQIITLCDIHVTIAHSTVLSFLNRAAGKRRQVVSYVTCVRCQDWSPCLFVSSAWQPTWITHIPHTWCPGSCLYVCERDKDKQGKTDCDLCFILGCRVFGVWVCMLVSSALWMWYTVCVDGNLFVFFVVVGRVLTQVKVQLLP